MELGDIKTVFKHLAEIDGSVGSPFERRNNNHQATIRDFSSLIEKLAKHYSLNEDRESENDLSIDDTKTLADIFNYMPDYYFDD